MKSRTALLAAGATVAALAVPAVAATAAGVHHENTTGRLHVIKMLSHSYIGPLQFAVGRKYVTVADSFTSTLSRIGSSTPIAHGPDPSKGGDLAGVAVNGSRHEIAYTSSNGSHSVTTLTVLRNGKKYLVDDLAKFEKARNPDHVLHYGTPNATACQRKALQGAHIPVSYRGELDSHPYAVARMPHNGWAVADAGGNDVLSISSTGHISVLAVIPRQPLVVSKAFAKASHLPACTIGMTYWTEGVPTDVERGPHGNVYVSSLPGGPEGPGTPPRGSVYRINFRTHAMTRIGSGLHDATNVAVTPHGNVYVAELGANRISVLRHGKAVPVFKMAAVAAIELAHGHVYASSAPAAAGQNSPGRIVVLDH